VRVLKRHSGGGNILHFDGNVRFVNEPGQLRLAYWEPDYTQWSPGW